MRLILVLLVFLAAQSAGAFSYVTGGCASGGCSNTPGEQWLSTNADEIDTALDAIETINTSQASTLTALPTTYLALSGGTMTGGLIMGSGSSIDLASGVTIAVASGAGIEPAGTGYILATAMSATGQIDDNDLAAGAVDGGTGGEIADGTITAADIQDGSITGTDILNDTVVLITDTAGDFIATLTGDSEITVSGSGTEGRAVTLAIASSLTRDTELDAKSAATSTDNAVARFDLGAGDIQDSLVTIADSTGSITTPGTISAGGSTGASTFTLRNTVDSGWVECGVVGTTMTCAVDADGTPDGTL